MQGFVCLFVNGSNIDTLPIRRKMTLKHAWLYKIDKGFDNIVAPSGVKPVLHVSRGSSVMFNDTTHCFRLVFNQRPFNSKSKVLLLSHCAPIRVDNKSMDASLLYLLVEYVLKKFIRWKLIKNVLQNLKVQSVRIFCARLASLCHLGLISDPLIGSKFHNGIHDSKEVKPLSQLYFQHRQVSR